MMLIEIPTPDFPQLRAQDNHRGLERETAGGCQILRTSQDATDGNAPEATQYSFRIKASWVVSIN